MINDFHPVSFNSIASYFILCYIIPSNNISWIVYSSRTQQLYPPLAGAAAVRQHLPGHQHCSLATKAWPAGCRATAATPTTLAVQPSRGMFALICFNDCIVYLSRKLLVNTCWLFFLACFVLPRCCVTIISCNNITRLLGAAYSAPRA